MGVPFSKDFIERVRDAGDIVRLISDYVPLKQAGTRWKGLCPFHQEKTPSFSVDPEAQLFYCFGCTAGGDSFKFVMLYEKVDFREAVEMLARRWGVAVPSPTRKAGDASSLVREMNGVAEEFFRATLVDPDGGRRCRTYLERRGLGKETTDRLGLGYAADGWENLRGHLLSRRFKPEQIVTGGLAVRRKDGNGEYDRFRDRLIFPIRNASGHTVAFGGRTLGTAEPKYLNSPETPAYVKGDHLYGLDLAREAIRRDGFAVVVEGYLDVAALMQFGFDNAVASLGTAFTPAQARLLSRFANRVVVSYDGDAAGTTAATRSFDLLLARGFDVRVAELPEGKDPDDFLREHGADAYRKKIDEAPGYLEFLIRREVRSRDLSRPEEQVAAVNAVLPRIARLGSAVERATWSGRLASSLGIEDSLILQELRAALASGKSGLRHRIGPAPTLREAESRLVRVLLARPDDRRRATDLLDTGDLEGTRVARIVRAILDLERDGREVSHPTVLESLEREDEQELLKKIAFRDDGEARAGELDECLSALKRSRLRREGSRIQQTIQHADSKSVDELLTRKMALARQIDSLS